MQATGKAKTVIWRWQERFRGEGAAGLRRDKTRPSCIPLLSPEVAERIVAMTPGGPPPAAASHWTGSAMAKRPRLASVPCSRYGMLMVLGRIWCGRFKLSNDPQFAAKLKETIGLYTNPPDHAVVLAVDEKRKFRRWIASSRGCR